MVFKSDLRIVGRMEEADGVPVAELKLHLANSASVGALILGDGSSSLC